MCFEDSITAAKAGDLDKVRALVAADPALIYLRDDEGSSLFDHACWALLVGDYSRPPQIAPDPDGARMGIVQHLLDLGVDPNAPGEHDWTPLHTALYENHIPLTRLLLELGANPRAEVHAPGGTPIVQALFWGHAEAADVLAAQDITPLNLRVAAGLGRADLIEIMVGEQGGIEPQAGAGRGYYRPHEGFPEWKPADDVQEILDEALCYAARNGRLGVMPRLVELGADVSSDVYAGTPLHWAAARGHAEVTRWLIEQGADVNKPTMYGAQFGVTPLHCAAWADQVETARLLLEGGADRRIKDATHTSTPLEWAEYMQSPGVVALLRG